MGNAVDHDEILLQPYELATLMPLLADLHREGRERDFLLLPGNNIGYFGPYDVLWRGPDRGYYSGCPAGQNAIGLEADGTLKGCPSLATARYGAGDAAIRRSRNCGQPIRRCNSTATAAPKISGAFARAATMRKLAGAAVPGPRTYCSAAAATIPTATIGC